MTPDPGSGFRFEKRRAAAVVTLVSGESVRGSFFTASADTRRVDGERIGDLLNADTGFLPFERDEDAGPQIVLLNRIHIISVALFADEAGHDAGYDVATARSVSILLSHGQRIQGLVRIYRPEGRDRVSDWARQTDMFRYIETKDATLIVNAAHIVAITEAPGA